MLQDWERLERVFSEALELPAAERLSFVSEQSGDDAWLLHELETLLEVSGTKAGQALDSRTGIVRQLLGALDTEFAVGRELGGYRIESLISAGGMGIVYKAVETASGEAVALKLLPPEDSDNPKRIRRLAREARALQAMAHPGIVRIREFRSQPSQSQGTGSHFIVMELVEGETLQTLLANGAASGALRRTLDWGAQIAEAVEAAHAGGVVHRDLKPANIMIEARSGRVKLLDFGLARMADSSPSPHTQTTADGTVAGTFSYFSPEQASGNPGDERSDIFSFGAVLYEMIAGRKAFDRSGPLAIAAAVLHQPCDRLPAEVPRPVKILVERCLEKDPARRFPTMRSVREEMERLRDLERAGHLKPPLAPKTRKRIWTAAAAAIVMTTLGTGGWLRHERQQAFPPRSLAVLPFTDANRDAANQYFVDGLTIEFANDIAHLKNVRVAPRSAVISFKMEPRNLREIGRQLKVSHLLETSVERLGDQIRIVASLERTSDGAKLWTNTYQRRTADLASIETDLEARIAASLGTTASAPRQKHVPPEQAHEYYLKAIFEADEISLEANALAQRDFRRALELDPDFALAYAGLAAALWNRNNAVGTPFIPAEIRESEALCQKAVQLDPGLAKAHVALAMFAMRYDWDWNRAERELQTALSISPSAGAEMNFASLDLILGRRNEADQHLRRAQDLDPLSAQATLNVAGFLALEGRFAESREQVRKIASQEPTSERLQTRLNFLDAWLDRPGSPIENLRASAQRQPYAGELLAKIEAHNGNRDAARSLMRRLEPHYQDGHLVLTWAAQTYALMDDAPDTVKWLERAMDVREDEVAYIHVDPAFAKLQNTPAFHALKKRMNLDW